MHLTKH